MRNWLFWIVLVAIFVAGNVLTLSPPLIIAREDLDRALSIVEDSILEG